MSRLPLPWLVVLTALFSGCASQVPPSIRIDGGESLSVAQVQADPEGTRGRIVRWGGEILQVVNRRDSSDVVVLRRPLFDDGEPKPDGGEAKRFVARFSGFVDPAAFRPGERLTVSGRLEGLVTIPVGAYPYRHPVVRVAGHYRWPKWEPVPEPPWHRDPFYCDPFWPWAPRPWGHPYCW